MYFITGNKGKYQEAKNIIPELEQLAIDLPEIQHIDPRVIIKDKLQRAQEQHQGRLVVEDISLYLDCLNGLPGPLIKWFMKTVGNEGLYQIANKFNNYNAEAKALLGYSDQEGKINFFEGIIKGTIVHPRGDKGFGWDPIFQPNGHDKTFAEMTPEEKNQISMRRRAFQKLKDSLNHP